MKKLEDILFKNTEYFFIAEIGNNHQGDINIAKEMISTAKRCGVQAVKFQKRNNKTLLSKELYNKPYDNVDSFGDTYGKHREALEFNFDQYIELMEHAKKENIVMFATAIDVDSVGFLEEVGNPIYKIASADLDNEPLIECVSQKNKPIIISTGAGDLNQIKRSYDIIKKYNPYPPIIMQCTCMYPVHYDKVNLRVIETYKKLFSDALIGYSGHDNGIVLPIVAYMLGARVFEKHFTLNRAWRGADNKFSLEPTGLSKSIRDLNRAILSLGDGEKRIYEEEIGARVKLGKSIYSRKKLPKGKKISLEDICCKSPAGGISPSKLHDIIGLLVNRDIDADEKILQSDLI
ncbi:MAG: N-acetylneuraminate synthase family protein [Oligoflexia bacterium]|nr:N-acetylneuraminate synthase family protein [Oligoflexia bacterium]